MKDYQIENITHDYESFLLIPLEMACKCNFSLPDLSHTRLINEGCNVEIILRIFSDMLGHRFGEFGWNVYGLQNCTPVAFNTNTLELIQAYYKFSKELV